jgi:hypothetical protein
MARLPHSVVVAPIGMDVSSEPVGMSLTSAQLLVNMRFDRIGQLISSFRIEPQLATPMPKTIVGLWWYYSAIIANSQVPPFQADAAIIVTADGFFLSNYQPAPPGTTFHLAAPFRIPSLVTRSYQSGQFGLPSTAPNTLNPITPRMRFATLLDEVIAVQEGGYYPVRIVSYGSSNTYYPNLTVMFNAGIIPPGAPGGLTAFGTGVLTGDYDYRTTLEDERGRESSPSAKFTVATTTQKVHGTVLIATDAAAGSREAPDRQAKFANLYRDVQGNPGAYYRVARWAIPTAGSGSYQFLPYTHSLGAGDFLNDPSATADNFSDTAISGNPVMPNLLENDVPNPASIICVHNNRIFLNDVTNSAYLQISNLLSPTQYTSFLLPQSPVTDGLRTPIGTDQGDPILGLFSLGSYLGIMKRRGTWFLSGTDITDYVVRQANEKGCIAPDTIKRCGDVVFYLAEDGIYQVGYEGGSPSVTKVGQEIDLWLQNLPLSDRYNAFALFQNNWYIIFVGMSIFYYDFTTNGWGSMAFGDGLFNIGLPGIGAVLIPPPSGDGLSPPTTMPPGSFFPPGGGSGGTNADPTPGNPITGGGGSGGGGGGGMLGNIPIDGTAPFLPPGGQLGGFPLPGTGNGVGGNPGLPGNLQNFSF